MSRWFRMHDCILDDPKVQRLPGDLFKTWVNLLCVASRHDGRLPDMEDLAFMLRTTEEDIADDLDSLIKFGLIDDEDGYVPHNWNERQYKSDVSTDRVKRFRERCTKQAKPVTETPPETEADTEAEQKTRTPAKSSFEQDCRSLVGEEPVLLALDFQVIERLVEGGDVTPDDVKAGIRAAMERPNFRIRHWSQLEGWARGAAKDRLAGKSKATVNGHKSSLMPEKRIWLPQGSPGYEAWRTAFPGTVKAILTSKGSEQGILMPSEFPPANGAAA
jgi:hypothetical protein